MRGYTIKPLITPTLTTLVVTLAIQALTSMAAMAVPVLAPAAAQDFGMNAAYVGVFVGVIYLGATCATLTSGSVIHRYGAIRVSQLSLAVSIIGLALLLCNNRWLLIVSALLIGLGYGPVTPASSHVLIKTVPKHLMSLVFSIKQTGVPLGGALAGVVLPPLIVWFGWKIGVVVIIVACAGLVVMSGATRRRLDGDRHPDHRLSLQSLRDPLRLIWSDRKLRLLGVSSFFFCVVQVSLSTYLTPYLVFERNYSLISAGIVFSAAQTAGVVGRIIWGYVSDRYLNAPVTLGALGIVMCGACAAAIVIGPKLSWTPLLAIFVVYGATAIGWNGVFLAEVARQAPAGLTGSATGGALAITYLGAVVGPPLFGLMVSFIQSYGTALIIVSMPAAICGLALLRCQKLFHTKTSP